MLESSGFRWRGRPPFLTTVRSLSQPTLSIDAVPTRTVTKAVIGGMAFAVGKTLDLSPSLKLGKLPVKARSLVFAS